jgi:hypothetical protein
VTRLIEIERNRLMAEAALSDGKSGRVRMIPGLSGLKPEDALAKWHENRRSGLSNYTEVQRCDLVIKETYERVKKLAKEVPCKTKEAVELQQQ